MDENEKTPWLYRTLYNWEFAPWLFYVGSQALPESWHAIRGGVLVMGVVLFLVGLISTRKKKQSKIEPLRFVIEYKDQSTAPSMVHMITILEEQGLDLKRPFEWYDDPVRGVRIFTQEPPKGKDE